MSRLPVLALLLLSPSLLPAAGEATAPASIPPAPAALPLGGTVTKTDATAHTLTLRHAALGNLAAGETQFLVGAGDSLVYKPGSTLRGDCFPQGKEWKLENIWPTFQDDQEAFEINRQLRRDTVTRGRKVVRTVGEYIPKAVLLNQEGKLIRWDVNRRDYKVINFIFTRCPEPTKCPASTQRMARLQEEGKTAGVSHLQLYSLTFDPDNDTPGVLKDYALSHNLDTANFTLLTGEKSVMLDLTKQFGIIQYRLENTIEHTMATVLVNPNGKILYRAEGSRWSVEDFISRIKADMTVREAEESALLPRLEAPVRQVPEAPATTSANP